MCYVQTLALTVSFYSKIWYLLNYYYSTCYCQLLLLLLAGCYSTLFPSYWLLLYSLPYTTKWLTSTTLSMTTTVSKWLLLLTTGCYTSLLLLYSTPLLLLYLLLLLYSNPLFTTSKLPDFDLQGSSNHVAAVNCFLAIFPIIYVWEAAVACFYTFSSLCLLSSCCFLFAKSSLSSPLLYFADDEIV